MVLNEHKDFLWFVDYLKFFLADEIGNLMGKFCEPVIFVVTGAGLDVFTSQTFIIYVVHVAM